MNDTNTKKDAPKPPPPTGVDVTNKDGLKEHLKYRALDIDELYQVIDLIIAGNTPAIVALVMKRPREWVNSLTRDSFRQIIRDITDRGTFTEVMDIAADDPITNVRLGEFRMEMARLFVSAAQMSSSLRSSSSETSGTTSSSEPAPTDSPEATTAPA